MSLSHHPLLGSFFGQVKKRSPNPTYSFATLQLQNPPYVSELQKIRQSLDLKALKLWKSQSETAALGQWVTIGSSLSRKLSRFRHSIQASKEQPEGLVWPNWWLAARTKSLVMSRIVLNVLVSRFMRKTLHPKWHSRFLNEWMDKCLVYRLFMIVYLAYRYFLLVKYFLFCGFISTLRRYEA